MMLRNHTMLIGTGFAVLAAALAACSGATPAVVPGSLNAAATNASVQGINADAGSIPGHGEFGVSAHYVVFKQIWDTPTIVVIAVQSAGDYLKAFPGSTRIAGATIVYPDGSKQVTNAQGEFDAGMSSYAQAHPEKIDGTDIIVHVEAPAASALKPIVTTIFAPSESEEKKIDSGVVPPGTKPVDSPSPGAVVRLDGYIWSCNPLDYKYNRLFPADPEKVYEFFIHTHKGAWYEPHFYTCGTDQPSDAAKWWNLRWKDQFGGLADVWTVDAEFKPGHGGVRLALWWSPSNYHLFHHNIHDMLISLQNEPSW
jgi:hypothetical protein